MREVVSLENKSDVLDSKSKLLFETSIVPVRGKIDTVEACVTLRQL
jgi:hypothetical protein